MKSEIPSSPDAAFDDPLAEFLCVMSVDYPMVREPFSEGADLFRAAALANRLEYRAEILVGSSPVGVFPITPSR